MCNPGQFSETRFLKAVAEPVPGLDTWQQWSQLPDYTALRKSGPEVCYRILLFCGNVVCNPGQFSETRF